MDWEIEKIIESSQSLQKSSSMVFYSNFTNKLVQRYELNKKLHNIQWDSFRKSVRAHAITASYKESVETLVPATVLQEFEMPIIKICGNPFVKWDDVISFINTNKEKYDTKNTPLKTQASRPFGDSVDYLSFERLSFSDTEDPTEGSSQIKVEYPTVDELRAHHEEALNVHGGLWGDREGTSEKLEAAIGRMSSGFGSSEFYPSVIEKAAVLAHSIISTHPFSDGNKRTAFLAAAYFLANHGIVWDADAEDLADLIIQVASNEREYEDLVEWFDNNTRDMTDEEWENYLGTHEIPEKLAFTDLPNAEQYDGYYSELDYSPREIVDNTTPRKKQNDDPVKKRPDFNYEKTLFEKGEHSQNSFNSPNVNRPLTPYGSATNDIVVKCATIDDVGELARLSIRAFDDTLRKYEVLPPPGYDDPEFVKKYVETKTCYKIERGGRILGAAMVDPSGDVRVHITRIFIDPDAQGSGFGKKLLSAVENHFPNTDSFSVNTPRDIKPNVDFYKSMGYKIQGISNTGNPKLVFFTKPNRGL